MDILSVDMNLFGQRAVLLDAQGNLLKHYVAKPRESASRWLGLVLDEQSGQAVVVGSPLDEWPEGTAQAVERAGHQLRWLNPSLMRRLYNVCRPWNLHRKLHRACFLGHLHLWNADIWDAEPATREFEAKAAREILNQLGLASLSSSAVRTA